MDAKGRQLDVVTIEAPSQIRPTHGTQDFAAGYINFYVINQAVVMPEFGDLKADENARDIIKKLFPKR